MKSDGMQEISFGYVGDCAIAILTILTKGDDGEAYNIFVEPSAAERAGYSKITKAVMSVEKLMKLGWVLKFGAESGIKRTVSYLKRRNKER